MNVAIVLQIVLLPMYVCMYIYCVLCKRLIRDAKAEEKVELWHANKGDLHTVVP